jgi:predicted nucleic acid-binding Zn ribbon protein
VTRRRSEPVLVGPALARVLEELGHGSAAALLRVAACWADAVGAELAARAEPVALRGRVLEVRAASSVWCQELQLRRGEILAGLARALGSDAPDDLRFHVG